MKTILGLLTLAALAVGVAGAAAPSDPAVLEWAFPGKASPPAAGPDATRKLTLPGSDAAFTDAELHDLFAVPDWRPATHPAMPSVVATGRKPDVMACGFCHQPNGEGRPENASLAGLPQAYIVEQVQAFASGARAASAHAFHPSELMIQVAKAATPAETDEAAAYFSALTFQSHVRVQEVATIGHPVAEDYLLVPRAGAAEEPIGDRIVEAPVSMEHFERRDPQTDFIAYVPLGSLKRGAALAQTQSCAACHGEDLRGGELGPPLAGRSPSYMFRQLLAFHTGARTGPATLPMKGIAANLSASDMVALAAYAGSLQP